MSDPLIDVRPEADFAAGHFPGAANIPLEELTDRVHELPTRETPLRVMDADAGRARRAAELLRRRGAAVTLAPMLESQLTERGPSHARLWQPTPFLVQAVDRIGSPGGAALDIACGTGRDAVYLATRGYAVEAVDVLPDALQKAHHLARRCGVRLQTRVQDLQRDPHLPAGRYGLVTVFRYLQRSLFPALRAAVAPRGYVACETFHELNRQTGRRPQDPAHLLRSDELRQAFTGFEIICAQDGYEREGRYFSCLLARRPQ